MAKSLKVIRSILFSVILLTLALIVYGFFTIPDEINPSYDNKFLSYEIYTYQHAGKDIEIDSIEKTQDIKQYEIDVSIFGTIPIKTSSLTVSQRRYVNVSGDIFGLRIFTDGILIVGIDTVESSTGQLTPAQDAGLQAGDTITAVDGKKLNSCADLITIFEHSKGQSLNLEYVRGDEVCSTNFSLAYSDTVGKFKAGIWVRDSAAGIGTMTFFDQSTGMFAGLGHAVCDIDTGKLLEIKNGDIVNATINGCFKGTNGKAGELCGTFTSNSTGVLVQNGDTGVYGYADSIDTSKNLMPVALKSEIKKGYAQIIATIDQGEPQFYDIEITKISNSNELKNMVIKVTDSELIEKTGGIVQGMSGSPIVQNGKLIGAVTHVFINDPTSGYAIFIGDMMDTVDSID